MIETLTQILPEVMPYALGILSPQGLAYTAVTGLAGLVTHFTASAFVATTKTPEPTTKWGKVYKLIEVLALAIGKAKENK